MAVKYRQVSSFSAKDGQGKELTLCVYQDFIVSTTLDGATSETPGMKSIRTTSGDAVTALGNGEYEVVRFGTRLTSSDPKRVE
jgi:hypothetical protein